MFMFKTFKYRLYPNREQGQKMHDTCFLCSLVYNQFLAERKEAYEKEQKSLSGRRFSDMKKVIIDTDPGIGAIGADIDDGLAIVMALNSPIERLY